MADLNLDYNALMQLMMGFLTTQRGGGQRVPYRSGGHITNTLAYQPTFPERIFNFLMPHRQQLAPPTMLQSDFERVRALSMQANAAAPPSTYGMNPVAFRMMHGLVSKTMGAQAGEALYSLRRTQPGLYNMLLAGPVNAMFGPGVEADKATASRDIYRYFAGRTFMTPRGVTQGISPGVTRQISQSLYSATYKDLTGTGLIKRMPNFNMQDMSDIMKLGLDYGMRMPTMEGGGIDANKLVQNTKNLARVIDAGMAIFQTMDKEKVVQNLMELTRGTVPLSNTAQLEQSLYRFSTMAKTLNVSTKFLSQISTQTAAAYEQAGLPGQLGVSMGPAAFGMAQMMQRRGFMTAPQIAAAGGVQGLTRAINTKALNVFASTAYDRYALMYGAARAGLQPGMTQQEVIRNVREGVLPTVGNRQLDQALFSQITQETRGLNLTQGAVSALVAQRRRELTRQGRAALITDVGGEMGPEGAQRAAAVAEAREALKYNRVVRQSDQDRWLQGINKDETKQTALRTIMIDYFRNREGMSRGEAYTQANAVVGMLKVTPQDLRMREASRKAIDISTMVRQRNREGTSALQFFKEALAFGKYKFGGDIGQALLAGLPGRVAKFGVTGKAGVTSLLGRFKGLGAEEFADRYRSFYSANPMLRAVGDVMMGITGLSIFESGLTREAGIEFMTALEADLSTHKGKTPEKRNQLFSDAMKRIGAQNASLKDAERYMDANGNTWSAFNEWLRTKGVKDSKSNAIEGLKGGDNRRAFFAYLAANTDKQDIQIYRAQIRGLQDINRRTGGKLFTDPASVMSKAELKRYEEFKDKLKNHFPRIMEEAVKSADAAAKKNKELKDYPAKLAYAGTAANLRLARKDVTRGVLKKLKESKDEEVKEEDTKGIMDKLSVESLTSFRDRFLKVSDALLKDDAKLTEKAMSVLFATDAAGVKKEGEAGKRILRYFKVARRIAGGEIDVSKIVPKGASPEEKRKILAIGEQIQQRLTKVTTAGKEFEQEASKSMKKTNEILTDIKKTIDPAKVSTIADDIKSLLNMLMDLLGSAKTMGANLLDRK
jgi:hypothetical protein